MDKRDILAERYILSLNPLLYLPLWRDDGTKFHSRDAKGYLCTATGAIWTPQGRLFRAQADKIQLPDNVFINTPQISVVAWINMSSYGADARIFRNNVTEEVALWMASNRFTFVIEHSGGTQKTLTGSTIKLSQWYGLIGTFDGNLMRLHENGVLINESPQTASIDIGVSTPQLNLTDVTTTWNGLFGECIVFPFGLTISQAQKITALTGWRYR